MDNLSSHFVRRARPSDYDRIAAVVDAWWGRPVLGSLPRLFLDHFHRSSLVAEHDAGLTGFLVGIVSPSEVDEAYIHFVGVHPHARSIGLARNLYEQFFQLARAYERQVVRAITAPVNEVSIAFHQRLGFSVTGPVADYNGPGRDSMVFERRLS
jgi:ribosomal protein S18 acetylase RimI-like enzyme